MKEIRDTSITFRTYARTKELAQAAADADGRSLGNYLERLILKQSPWIGKKDDDEATLKVVK